MSPPTLARTSSLTLRLARVSALQTCDSGSESASPSPGPPLQRYRLPFLRLRARDEVPSPKGSLTLDSLSLLLGRCKRLEQGESDEVKVLSGLTPVAKKG